MKMAVPMGILVCLVLVSMGLTTYAIASDSETDTNGMEDKVSAIQSRSDYPDYDDLSSFFDFELGPPSITYHHIEDNTEKKTRPQNNKHYYHYDSEDPSKYKNPHPNTPPTKKHVVTPGTHYTSSTDKTFIEGEKQSNESQPVLNQAKIGPYQVSVVDADSPILSNLGLSKSDLERLAGYNKRTVRNISMAASDSTPTATYAENPRSNYPPAGYSPSNSPNMQSYAPPYDTSNPSPYRSNYGGGQHKPNENYLPSDAPNSHGSYSHPPASIHPPPQGSYDSQSYRAVQGANPHGPNGYNYPPPSYNQPQQSYNQPPPAYNQPPPPSSYNNPPPPQPSYNSNSHSPSSYSSSPPSTPYNNHPPQSQSYSPQRSSNVPWRPTSQTHVDWDDKPRKHGENWHESGPYPPHPAPLPYSGASSNSGNYYPKPSYGATAEKSGHRHAASYNKPDSTSKPSYTGSSPVSSSPSEYSSHKPSYYSSSSYSSSKAPSRDGTVTYAASSHHHHPAPAKPGITIRFKAKAPAHGHGHGHGHGSGISIPLSISPFDVVKKLLPSLNPLNNKKVTIGITIENKKDHHAEYLPY